MKLSTVAAQLVCLSVLLAASVCYSDENVNHIYVIRRPLDSQPVTSIGSFAHSAILLKTADERYFVLEYMSDSKSHLTEGKPELIKEYPGKNIATIKMIGHSDDDSKVFEWERQLKGKEVESKWTPEELKEKMQALMKEYSVFKKEHCHTAQERLRRELGIDK